MSQMPATTRAVFPEISSRAREHPADRTALSALRRLKGFDQIPKLLSGMLRERQHRLVYLVSGARVGPRQFYDLDALLQECADVLDAPEKPEFFVTQSPIANAYTIGIDKPFIRGIRDGLGGIVDGVGRAATTAADSLGRKIGEWRQKPE